ncbi:protein MpPR4 [Marchantia polymorpha subsp. ruderalis]|uniref:Barwin domain-containing protein n=2 Tax=Marchantia polymorpha TaxID=3197 RepID=A0A176WJW5_MARPO|nr:hypothetical protein AXG93_673s1200 [Marchantia polymorpha subsp. ruderalis]PTQ40339.1 hypothetical protein MARPO_0040s0024 [Marchantia polymorpha]BBN03238.1 hypothetical protein Mp_2g21910 [Marchantia polymorpha subsp. ruderalis]|eukprot:PTQ40339.1 hypothetical protein MARPO_0040s0024 [Marchantia polymorpha]
MNRQQLLVLWFAVSCLSGVLPVVLGQSGSGIYTTYHYYDPAQNGYRLDGLYCATWRANESLQWRSQYPWTAFCAGPMGEAQCGKCIRVTNPSTGQSVVVRILDKCANGGLDLDRIPFNQIDSNGQGYAAGHMTTSYTFVNC